MKLQDIDRKYMAGFIGFAVIVLLIITVMQPSGFQYQDKTDYAALQQKEQQEYADYKAYYDSFEVDEAASKQYLEEVVTEKVIKMQVDEALQTNRKITVPQIKDSEIQVVERTDRDSMVNYITDFQSIVENYESDIQAAQEMVFNPNADTKLIEQGESRTKNTAQNLRKVPVPKDAAILHKAAIGVFDQLGNTFDAAGAYAANPAEEQWGKLYEYHYVSNEYVAQAQQEIERLGKVYALESVTVASNDSLFFKTAHAQFAVLDVWNKWFRIVEHLYSVSYVNFYATMVEKMVTNIERNFTITSHLYYADELDRFYSNQYLEKYVTKPVDRELIRNILPTKFCKAYNPEQVKNFFIAKGKELVGGNTIVDPTDPDFLVKLSVLLASPHHYTPYIEGFYTAMAAETQSRADTGTTYEFNSDGTKAGRKPGQGANFPDEIAKTVATLRDTKGSLVENLLNMGTNNIQREVGKLISEIKNTLVNKFAFIPLSGGSLATLKENKTCALPVQNPIAPVPGTPYTPPFLPPQPIEVYPSGTTPGFR